MNNKYFDIWFVLGDTPIYLRILFYLATQPWALLMNEYENINYWKNQKNQ